MAHNPYPPQIIGGAVYHKTKGDSYASACNNESIRVAANSPLDFEGIDLDLNLSKDLTAWGCHWPFPTRWDDWYDKAGFWTDKTAIKNWPDTEVAKLRVNYRGRARPIRTAGQLARTTREPGLKRRLIPCFEVKRCRPFADPNWWNDHFLPTMPKGVTPIIMSLEQYGLGIQCLAAAHEVGLPTMWLWRSNPPPRGYKAHVDLIKSQPGRKIYAVQ